MRWKIKKEWIHKEYIPNNGETWSAIYYLRQWNKKFWGKRISIMATGMRNHTEKMILAAFEKENNKKPFRNLKAYYAIADWKDHASKMVVLADDIDCDSCGTEINENNRFYIIPGGKPSFLCQKCNEDKRLLNKLKE